MKTNTLKQRSENELYRFKRAAHRMKIMIKCKYYCDTYSEEEWEGFLARGQWRSRYKSLHYPDILERYVRKEAKKPFGVEYLRSVATIDRVQNQYMVCTVGYNEDGSNAYQIDLHLAIEREKVVVYAYNYDGDLDEELEELGILRDDIIDG